MLTQQCSYAIFDTKMEVYMGDKYSEFIRKNAKDVTEAFDEFPVEEEWHQGKIENVVSDVTVAYGDVCEIGDIVFARKYQYSDGTTGKNHFFVIIDVNNTAVPIENFGMLISSNLAKATYKSNVLLKKDDNNHLKMDSIVKTDVVYKLLNNQIVFKIGKVDIDKVNLYKSMYYKNK